MTKCKKRVRGSGRYGWLDSHKHQCKRAAVQDGLCSQHANAADLWAERVRVAQGGAERRAEAASTAVRDVDCHSGQGDSQSNSETSAAFSVRAVKDHP